MQYCEKQKIFFKESCFEYKKGDFLIILLSVKRRAMGGGSTQGFPLWGDPPPDRDSVRPVETFHFQHSEMFVRAHDHCALSSPILCNNTIVWDTV